MKKNTVLAIVLSSLVILAYMFIQQKYFSREEEKKNAGEVVEKGIKEEQDNETVKNDTRETFTVVERGDLKEKKYSIETPLVRVVFTNNGGDILSYKLKEYKESSGESGVEMIKDSILSNGSNRAFSLSLARTPSPSFNGLFEVKERNTENGHSIAFIANIKKESEMSTSKSVEISEEDNERDRSLDSEEEKVEVGDYRIIKEYEFFNDEYMFSLTITIETLEGVKKSVKDVFYSLRSPSQIGPDWVLGDRYEYRKFYSYSNSSMQTIKLGEGEEKTETFVSRWLAVSGKYFALAIIPEKPIQMSSYSMKYRDKNEAPPYDSQFFIHAPISEGNKRVDLYHVYIGPASDKFLSKYNVAKNNVYKLNNEEINRIAATGGLLWPLEMALKFVLETINRLVQNWGLSILIMTLIMRLLFFPLTKKSSKATRKMQEMQPKIKELQEKYKGNPQRLNTEMTMLYQKAGYSPLSGCLPMLIQIPFLFAMFALFNNYFEFRGASFIPGWIGDLSAGDSVWKFGFSLPVLGWTDLRLLPIIYVASQLVFGKVTQAGPQDNSNPTMKLMVYFMPIFFFFIFYNAPSGLLLFWTASNILMLIQQIIINKALDKEEARKKKKM